MPRTAAPARALVATAAPFRPATIAGVLAAAGYTVDAIGPATRLRSRHVTRLSAVRAEAGTIVEHVARRLADRPDRYRRIVLLDDDLVAAAADAGLAAALPVPLDRAPAVRSKYGLWAALEGSPARVPVTVLCASPRDAAAAVAERFDGRYPVVAKTARSIGGDGVQLICAPAEFATRIAGPWPIAVQPLLSGRPATTDVLFDGGVPIRWISSWMRDCMPNRFAPSTRRTPFDHQQIEPVLEAVGRATGFTGFAGLDWTLDDDGRPLVFELNPRPTTGFDLHPAIRAAFAHALRTLDRALDERDPLPRLGGAIPARADRDLPQFPRALFYAIAVPADPLTRARRTASALRSAPWDDGPRMRSHAAEIAGWLFDRTAMKTSLVNAARALKGGRPAPEPCAPLARP